MSHLPSHLSKAASLLRFGIGLVFAHCLFAAERVHAEGSPEEITIGVSTALTGSQATFGADIRNALALANEMFGHGRYRFVLEDDRCDNREAVTVAHKLIDVTKVKYVMGHGCNGTLIASLPVYRRANVLVLSSFATTGEIRDVGEKSFRLFPPDQLGAVKLFEFVKDRFKSVAFFTAQDDYTELMERWFRKTATERGSGMSIASESLKKGDTDFRSALTKLKQKHPDLLVLNVNGEADFILAVKQAREVGIKAPLTAFYLPASQTTISALGPLVEGMEFINLPLLENALSVEGKTVIAEFRKRFGPPQSIELGVALTIDSLRFLDLALASGMPPEQFLRGRKLDSLIGPISFDESGEVQGIPFQIQKIVDGKVVVLVP